MGNVWEFLGTIENVEISRQNTHLLLSSFEGELLKSIDGGYTWFTDSLAATYFNLLRISPFNDQILFGDSGYWLYKSTDGGMNYYLVDSSLTWNYYFSSQLFFDPDSVHIYGITGHLGQFYFLVSSDAGDSWQVVFSNPGALHLTIDPLQSGHLFVSEGSEIRESLDFGNSFVPYWTLPQPVVGLYKKPGFDILYAATSKDIYEITPTDTISLKHLSTVVSIDEGPNAQPDNFQLFQNFPNPFNPTTTIRLSLPKTAQVKLTVFNSLGQQVAVLLNERKPVGRYTVEFDGSGLPSGVYYYRIEAGAPSAGSPKGQAGQGFRQVRKMILLK